MGEAIFERLKKKYFRAFTLIILFACFSQGFIQAYIYIQKPNSKIINVSGRQRMLSQRIPRLVLDSVRHGRKDIAIGDELQRLIKELIHSHAFLKEQSMEKKWGTSFYSRFHESLSSLDEAVEKLAEGVSCYVDRGCPWDEERTVHFVTEADFFLLEMDKVVKSFEVYSQYQNYQLGVIELALFLLTLLILCYEYIVVVLPLNRYVKHQVDSLEKKHQEFLEQQALVRHSSKLATVGELAAGVGHEINNPLTIMFAHFAKLKIIVKDDSPQIVQTVNKLEKTANRIATIVRGLQKFSRGNDKELEEFNLPNVVVDTVDSLKMFVGDSRVQIRFIEADDNIDKMVLANQGEVRQVVINLVKNAVDALKKEVDPKVEVSCYKSGKWVCVEVTDNGPGIPKDLQEKVFQPFFTTKDPNEGTGLGLAIIRRLVVDAGGTIEFESSSEGTTFKILYPSTLNKQNQFA